MAHIPITMIKAKSIRNGKRQTNSCQSRFQPFESKLKQPRNFSILGSTSRTVGTTSVNPRALSHMLLTSSRTYSCVVSILMDMLFGVLWWNNELFSTPFSRNLPWMMSQRSCGLPLVAFQGICPHDECRPSSILCAHSGWQGGSCSTLWTIHQR